MALQRCLGHNGERCGTLVENANRCTRHSRAVNRGVLQARRVRRPDMRRDEDRRAAFLAAWRAVKGDVCPGDSRHGEHPCTPDNPLTADHIHPVAAGGAEDGPLRPLCQRFNSSRGARHIA